MIKIELKYCHISKVNFSNIVPVWCVSKLSYF